MAARPLTVHVTILLLHQLYQQQVVQLLSWAVNVGQDLDLVLQPNAVRLLDGVDQRLV